mmetsp:Transcript_1865/g.3815  ORF Transcript_1865/g.3815 Transcript_1865/m.3815 type:complete len:117 (-) Transcript_1865:58-408(-)
MLVQLLAEVLELKYLVKEFLIRPHHGILVYIYSERYRMGQFATVTRRMATRRVGCLLLSGFGPLVPCSKRVVPSLDVLLVALVHTQQKLFLWCFLLFLCLLTGESIILPWTIKAAE